MGAINPGYQGVSENFYNNYNAYNQAMSDAGISAADLAAQKLNQNYVNPNVTSRPFTMQGGTFSQYNGDMREADIRESAAAEINRFGEFMSNLPGEFAYMTNPGDEEAKQKAKEDWTFNMDKLIKGSSSDRLAQLGLLAGSLPGQLIGGPATGFVKVTDELLGHNPITESEKRDDGKWYIPNYRLDDTQAITSGLSGGIDIIGSAFGASGKVFGAIGKGIAKNALKSATKQLEKGMAKEAASTAEKAIGKWAKWEMRSEKANRMAEGWIGKAFNTAGKPIKSTAGQIAADAGEEAFEETSQSLLDDVRYKNLDDTSLERALQSGLVGAIGGGMMSGVMTPINHHFARKNLEQNQKQDSNGSEMIESFPVAPEDYYSRIKDKDSVEITSNDVAQELRQSVVDKYGEQPFNREPASFNAKVSASADNNIRAHQVVMPWENIYLAWKRNGDSKLNEETGQYEENGRTRTELAIAFFADRPALAQAYQERSQAQESGDEKAIAAAQEKIDSIVNTAVENMSAIMDAGSEEEAFTAFRAHVRNRALDKNNRMRASFMRAPHTDHASYVTMDVVDVQRGGTFHFNPGTYKMFNGDLDGDTWTMEAAHNRVVKGRNVFDLIQSARPIDHNDAKRMENNWYEAQGKNVYGWEEAGFSKAAKDSSAIKMIFHRYLNSIFGVKRVDSFINSYSHAWSDKNGGDENAANNLGALFQNIYDGVAAATDPQTGEAYGEEFAVDLVADMMYDVQMENAKFTVLDTVVAVTKEQAENLETDQGLISTDEGKREVANPSKGSIGRGTTPIQNLLTIGWKALLDPESQGVLRFDQAIIWLNKEIELMNAVTGSYMSEKDSKQAWISEMLHTIDNGENPSEMVEGAFMFSWRVALFQRLGVTTTDGDITKATYNGKRIGNGDDDLSFEKLINVARETFNETQAVYDEAIKKEGVNGYFKDPDAIFKAPIAESDTAPVVRRLRQLFGDWDAQVFLSDIENTIYEGYSLNQLCDLIEYGRIVSADLRIGKVIGEEANNLIDAFAKDRIQEKHAQGDSVSGALASLDLLRYVVREVDGKFVVDSKFSNDAEVMMSALRLLIGRQTCLNMNFLSDKQMLNGRYAQYLFGEGSSTDTRARAIMAIGISDAFRRYIDCMTRVDEDGNPNPDLVNAPYALMSVMGNNPLLDFIAYQIGLDLSEDSKLTERQLDDKNSRPYTGDELLRILIDPGKYKSFEDLYKFFERTFTFNINRGEFLAMAITDPTAQVPGADLSMRVRESRDRSGTLVSKSAMSAQTEFDEFKNLYLTLNSTDKSQMLDSLKYYALVAADESNSDILSSAVYASTSLTREGPEKAQAFLAYALGYMEAGYLSGNFPGAFLNQLGFATGAVSLSDAISMRSIICRALYDPEYSEMVCIGGKKAIRISQEKIFSAYGIVKSDDRFGYTTDDYMQLFEQAPTLLQWTFPIKWMSGSTTEPQLVATKTMTPKERYNHYKRYHNTEEFQQKQTRNKILTSLRQDPDFPFIICGLMGDDIDKYADNPKAFMRSCKQAIETAIDIVAHKMSETYPSDETREWKRSYILDLKDQVADVERSVVSRIQDMVGIYTGSVLTAKDSSDARIVNGIFIAAVNKEIIKRNKSLPADKKIPLLGSSEDSQYSSQDDISREALLDDMARVQGGLLRVSNLLDAINDENVELHDSVRLAISHTGELYQDAVSRIGEDGVAAVLNTPIDIVHKDKGGYKGVLRPKMSAKQAYQLIKNFANSGQSRTDLRGYVPEFNQFKEVWEGGKDGNVDEVAKGRLMARWNTYILKQAFQDATALYHDSGLSDISATYKALDWFDDTARQIKEDMREEKFEPSFPVDDNFKRPRLNYSEQALVLADRSSFGLAAGGVPIMSGMDAGSYQWMSAAALAPSTHKCSRDGSKVTAKELQDLLNKHHGQLRVYRVDNNGDPIVRGYRHTASGEQIPITEFIMTPQRLAHELFDAAQDGWDSDLYIDSLRVYKPLECTDPCCTKHYVGVRRRGKESRGYNPGKYTLTELLYTLSEARVFKSKKKRNAFNKIFHTAVEALEIKNASFKVYTEEGTTYEDFVNDYFLWRDQYIQKLAEYIVTQFKKEKIAGDFDLDAAMILAQFSTPCAYVKLKDGRTVVIDNKTLSSEEEFNRRFNIGTEEGQYTSIGDIEIEEMRPLTMSIIDISKKMNSDYITAINTRDDINSGSDLTDDIREEIYQECFGNWDGFVDDDPEAVKAITSKFPVVTNNMVDRIPTSRAETALQRFLSESTDSPVVAHTEVKLEDSLKSMGKAVFPSEDSIQVILREQAALGLKSDAKEVITRVEADNEAFSVAIGNKNRGEVYNGINAQHISENMVIPGKTSLVIVDINVASDPEIKQEMVFDIIEKYSHTAGHTQLLLSPSCVSAISSDPQYSHGFRGSYSDPDIAGGMFKNFMLFDPATVFDYREYMSETSKHLSGDPNMVVISAADPGYFGTGDSGSIAYKPMGNHTIHQDDHYYIDLKSLFKNAHKSGARSFEKCSIVTDSSELDHVAQLLDGTDTTSKDVICVPVQNDKGRKVGQNEIKQLMRDYFDPSSEKREGVIRNGAKNGTVIGFVKQEHIDGVVSYAPIWLNKGGMPFTFSTSDPKIEQGAKLDMHVVANLRFGDVYGSEEGYFAVKEYFPNVAWKSYTTMATDRDCPIKLGLDISVKYWHGQNEYVDELAAIGELYSWSTEKGRNTEYPERILYENLIFARFLMPSSFFSIRDKDTGYVTDISKVDYDRFEGILSKHDIDCMLNPFRNDIYWDIVHGYKRVSKDDAENLAFRKFFRNVLMSGRSGAEVITNFDIVNGKTIQRWDMFSWDLFLRGMNIDEVMTVFHALNPQITFKDRASDWSLKRSRKARSSNGEPTPLINSNGNILIRLPSEITDAYHDAPRWDAAYKTYRNNIAELDVPASAHEIGDWQSYVDFMEGFEVVPNGNPGDPKISDGEVLYYIPGHIHIPYFTDDSSVLGPPNTSTKHGSQKEMNMSLEAGVSSQDIDNVIRYMFAKNSPDKLFGPDGELTRYFDPDEESTSSKFGDGTVFDLLPEDFYERRRTNYHAREKRINRIIEDGNQTVLRPLNIKIENDEDRAIIQSVRDDIRAAMSIDGKTSTYKHALSDSSIDRLLKEIGLITYNNGTGITELTVSQYKELGTEIAKQIREHPEGPLIKYANTNDGLLGTTYRPLTSMVDRGLMMDILETPKYKQIYNGDYETFFKINKEATEELAKVIPITQDKDAMTAQFNFIDYMFLTHGDESYSCYLDDEGKITQQDWTNAQREFMSNLNPFAPHLKIDFQSVEDGIARSQRIVNNERTRSRAARQWEAETPSRPGKKTRGWNWTHRAQNFKLSREAANLSRGLAIMDPQLPVSARIQKGVFSITALITRRVQHKFGRIGSKIGPYDTAERSIYDKGNEQCVTSLRSDQAARTLFKAFLTAQWTQNELLTLQQESRSTESIIELAEKKMAGQSRIEKIRNGAYKFASGGDAFLANEMEIWADDFFHRIQLRDPDGNSFLLQKRSDGRTNFEHLLEENPAKLILDSMTLADDTNPFLEEALQSFQVGKEMELAGEDAVTSILSDALAEHSLFDFLFTTGLCRFPTYTWNANKFFFLGVLPTNTMEYILNQRLMEKQALIQDKNEELGLDYRWKVPFLGVDITDKDFARYQKRKSMRESIMMDVMAFGVKTVALALLCAGAFEPPEDDRLAGNLEEWTILGQRIKENWWLQDIFGPFLAICATWRSGELGKPRPDILINWLGNAMYSNPMIKVADVAAYLLDPTYDYNSEYEKEYKKYEDMKGGGPTLAQYWEANLATFTLQYGSQFVTPAFVRSFWNAAEPYEHSYKKVYAQGATGNDLDPTQTENTTYLDARIRAVSRKNPVLGAILDITHPDSETSYYQGGTPFAKYSMPRTLTADQAQIRAMNNYNVLNPDGSEKTDAEKRVVAFKVIAELNKTDDIKSLVENGFVLNYETREYVSKEIHDIRQDLQEEYNAWVQETGKDAYVVGDGDWATGQKLISETNEYFYNQMDLYKTIYYRLWDDEISYGVQYYNRANTTYLRDVNGDVYASGFSPSLFPYVTANGSLDNPGNTLGHEGNWVTESVIIPGESAGGRALIPINREPVDTPNIDSWGNDNNNGYSDLRKSNGDLNDSNNNSKSSGTPSNKNSGSRKSGGGGGGGGRKSGGGGGGYNTPPRFYLYNNASPISKPSRIMNADRLEEADTVSYLRPDFETKGSREAYKRSDI